MSAEEKVVVCNSSSDTKKAGQMSDKAAETPPISMETGMLGEEKDACDSSSDTKAAKQTSDKASEAPPISVKTGLSTDERVAVCDSSSDSIKEGQTAETPPTPSQHDIDLLTKLEEANRQLQIVPPTIPLPKTPLELELLEKLDTANRLLEADKKSCKGLTPTHSRSGSTAGPVTPSPILGHSRKGSSTSNISETSAGTSPGQNHEEETANPGGNIWEIWGKLVNDWASAKKKPAFIKQLVRKGIPNPFRCLSWQLILDVNHSPMKESYVEYLKQKSPSEKMIRRDIARTFPEHDFFKEKDGVGQESLFHVMKAYSLHDREVGYCQGSGFIVGLLLMQMPEEEAFAVLVKLMQDYRLRELFKPSMAELGLCMYKLECLIQELLPDLYTHFQTQSFHTSMYASSWFLTLFATVVPLSVACRVMDLFISEGMDVIFRIGIAILQSSQSELLSMDMEGMLHFFQKEIAVMFERDEDSLFNVAYHVRISAKKFKRLEKEYTALKTKQNEDQVELRRLRTENRLLRQRIDNLEKESATLADRLIQYQLTRAQEAEETYALKNELSLTKQRYSDSKKQLDQASSLLDDIKERTDSINSASTLDEGEAQVAVQGLQEELITVRLKEAENCSTIKHLRHKIDELEQSNVRLQKAPSNDVQCLQEELIAVKLREAEANLSMKEMRQIISDLDAMWQRHLEDADPQSSPKDKSNNNKVKNELKKTQEELMSVKLREAGALSHLKDTKQKVMELETSNQICSNQIRRMDEENKKLKGDIEEAAKQESEAQKQIKALLRKLDDLESKRKEEMMMARIREAENDQIVCELKQKIAHVEIQKEEVLAADRLQSKSGKEDLANTIFDLQEEVLQLRLDGRSKSSSSASPRSSHKEYEDDDDEDPDDIEDPESLNRTLSEIIEGKRSSTSLIAILNRENSDCDSIQSSGSENSASGVRLGQKNLKLDMSDSAERLSPGASKETDNAVFTNKSPLKTSSSNENSESVEVSAIDEAKNGQSVETHRTDVTGSLSGDISNSGSDSRSVNQSNPGGSDSPTVLNHDKGAMDGAETGSKVVCNGEMMTDSNKNINVDINTH